MVILNRESGAFDLIQVITRHTGSFAWNTFSSFWRFFQIPAKLVVFQTKEDDRGKVGKGIGTAVSEA